MSNGPTTTEMETESVSRSKDEILTSRQQLVVSGRTGLLAPADLGQALELAQSMAKGQQAVPAHLRGHPGACLAIIEYANNWEMAPYAVANQSYVVSDRLCFMGQLVHSVIKKRADLRFPKLGLEAEYSGKVEDGTRKVRVFAECYIDEERTVTRVLECESPMLKDIRPKSSPLWQTDPDQQLFYRTSQRWQRRHKPEILLGIYTKDEIEDMTPEERAVMAEDRGPATVVGRPVPVRTRTVEDGGEGFHPDNVQGIEGRDRPVGPIIDNAELANVAADVEQQPTESAPTTADRQSAGAESPASEEHASSSAPAAKADLFDPAEGTEAPAEKGPTNDAEYQEYLRAWLVAASDPAKIAARYKAETKLRSDCGADLKACKALKNARLEALGAPT